jgi:hypothetical protein
VQSRWFSSRSLVAHLAVIIWVPGCAAAAWWQVTVALAGDRLAYLYSVEWPCFAVFGVVVWWNLIHDDPDSVGARALGRARRSGVAKAAVQAERHAAPVPIDAIERIKDAEAADPALASYNDYLEELGSRARPTGWRRSGRAPRAAAVPERRVTRP